MDAKGVYTMTMGHDHGMAIETTLHYRTSESSDWYHKNWLTNFFHAFPHLDFTLSRTNATFDLDNDRYRQSLKLLSSVPLICCGVMSLMILAYYSYQACCRVPYPSNNQPSRCRKGFSWLMIITGIVSAIVIIYGSQQIQQGAVSCEQGLITTDQTVQSALYITNTVFKRTDHVEREQIPDLLNVTSGILNDTVREEVLEAILEIGQSLNITKQDVFFVENSTNLMDTSATASRIRALEYIRWVAVIVVCCAYIFVFLLIAVGFKTKSGKKLKLAAGVTIGVIMPSMCAVACLHMALAVGTGDLCNDPDSFLVSQLNNTIDKDLLSIYLKCKDMSQPFGLQLRDAQSEVSVAMTALQLTLNMSSSFNISDQISGPVTAIGNELESIYTGLSTLDTLVGSCQTLHSEYVTIVHAVCSTSLKGMGYTLLASCLACLICSFLLNNIALTWKSYGKKVKNQGGGCGRVDPSDPFLPTAGPERYSAVSGTVNTAFHNNPAPIRYDLPFAEALMINTGAASFYHQDMFDDSPPSSFQTSRLQEYSDLAPTPSCIRRPSQPSDDLLIFL